jgi:hypothetical protein
MIDGPCLRPFSVAWEMIYGWDSIPTVLTYERGGDKGLGAYKCVMPDCSYARFNVIDLWNHVHFSKKHDRWGARKREWEDFMGELHA